MTRFFRNHHIPSKKLVIVIIRSCGCVNTVMLKMLPATTKYAHSRVLRYIIQWLLVSLCCLLNIVHGNDEEPSWTSWSSCSVTCGSGVKWKWASGASSGIRCEEKPCPDKPLEYMDLPESSWTAWSPCTVTCGNGAMFRERLQKVCPEPTCFLDNEFDQELCHIDACYKKDSKVKVSDSWPTAWTHWTSWQLNSSACTSVRMRAKFDGKVLVDEKESTLNLPCNGIPKHTKISKTFPKAWTGWSPCSTTCGTGVRVRERQTKICTDRKMCFSAMQFERDTCMEINCLDTSYENNTIVPNFLPSSVDFADFQKTDCLFAPTGNRTFFWYASSGKIARVTGYPDPMEYLPMTIEPYSFGEVIHSLESSSGIIHTCLSKDGISQPKMQSTDVNIFISVDKSNVCLPLGSTVKLICNGAISHPYKTGNVFFWYYNNKALNGYGKYKLSNPRQEEEENQFKIILEISNIQEEELGHYICAATDLTRWKTSQAVFLFSHGCSEMNDPGGDFQSPFWPDPYPGKLEAVYIIYVSDIMKIIINFEICILGSEDYLEITDGFLTSIHYCTKFNKYSFSDDQEDRDRKDGLIYQSTSNHVTITLHSGGALSNDREGFYASYSTDYTDEVKTMCRYILGYIILVIVAFYTFMFFYSRRRYGHTSFTIEEQRWIIIGSCLNGVICSLLKTLLEDKVRSYYNHLVNILQVDQQTRHGAFRAQNLNYRNINSNHSKCIHTYDYRIMSHNDLAKLYVRTGISHLTAITDFDASALFGLLLGLIAEQRSTTQHIVGNYTNSEVTALENTTTDMCRNVRNRWAHSSEYSHWTKTQYNTVMRKLITFVEKLNLPSVVETQTLSRLQSNKQYFEMYFKIIKLLNFLGSFVVIVCMVLIVYPNLLLKSLGFIGAIHV